MKKIIIGAVLLFIMLSCSGIVFADNGTVKLVNDETPESSVTVTEHGKDVSYKSFCVDKNQPLENNEKVNTKNKIKTPKGVVKYIVNNWKENLSSEQLNTFQNNIWDICSNSNQDIDEYDDKYTVKNVLSQSNFVSWTPTTKTYDDGRIVKVYKETWSETISMFVFRMTGDEIGSGRQDLILFTHDVYEQSYTKIWEELIGFVEPTESEPPVFVNPAENNSNSKNTNENPNITTSPKGSEEETNKRLNSILIPSTYLQTNLQNSQVIPVNTETNKNSKNNENIDNNDDKNTEPQLVFAATMKTSGVPIMPILLTLIAAISGIAFRKKIDN